MQKNWSVDGTKYNSSGVKDKVGKEMMRQRIALQMTRNYAEYYELWKDFYLLASFLAILSLALITCEYELFYHLTAETVFPSPQREMLPVMSLAISLFAIFAIICKEYVEQIWREYKDPVLFQYLVIVRMVEEGLVDKDQLDSVKLKEKLRPTQRNIILRMMM